MRKKHITKCTRRITSVDAGLINGVYLMTEEERLHLQQTLLDMYKDIIVACKKYGIVPYLCGGSALGAVRHQGFIPWDDDLDVAFLRKDYKRFSSIFRKELGENYILNAPNFSKNAKARFPKIIKKNTIFQEIGTVSTTGLNGVFVDIFIIENVPKNRYYRLLKGMICNGIEFIAGCVYDFENIDVVAKAFHMKSGSFRFYFRMLIGFTMSIIPSSKWYDVIDTLVQWKDEKSPLCALATGRKHYFGEIFPREVISPPRLLSFCDIQAPVFNEVEVYLRNLYGEYMKIPSENERERHFIRELKL